MNIKVLKYVKEDVIIEEDCATRTLPSMYCLDLNLHKDLKEIVDIFSNMENIPSIEIKPLSKLDYKFLSCSGYTSPALLFSFGSFGIIVVQKIRKEDKLEKIYYFNNTMQGVECKEVEEEYLEIVKNIISKRMEILNEKLKGFVLHKKDKYINFSDGNSTFLKVHSSTPIMKGYFNLYTLFNDMSEEDIVTISKLMFVTEYGRYIKDDIIKKLFKDLFSNEEISKILND